MNQRIRELKELGKAYGITIYSGCEMFAEMFAQLKDQVKFNYRDILNPGVKELLTYCKKSKRYDPGKYKRAD